jgi:hypothetical protein
MMRKVFAVGFLLSSGSASERTPLTTTLPRRETDAALFAVQLQPCALTTEALHQHFAPSLGRVDVRAALAFTARVNQTGSGPGYWARRLRVATKSDEEERSGGNEMDAMQALATAEQVLHLRRDYTPS